jgi:hypothetical protein
VRQAGRQGCYGPLPHLLATRRLRIQLNKMPLAVLVRVLKVFHSGRDVLAPLAAHGSRGAEVQQGKLAADSLCRDQVFFTYVSSCKDSLADYAQIDVLIPKHVSPPHKCSPHKCPPHGCTTYMLLTMAYVTMLSEYSY